MKKSFLPLLAGLIGIAGITSASAWTKADPLTLAQQVASNYSSYPLKTFNGGAAFSAVNADASTDNRFSFTESDDCPSTTTRYYVLGVYDGDAELMHSGNNLTSDYGSSANWCFEKNTDNGDSKCGAKNKGTIKYTNQTPYYLSGLKISKTGACGTITLTKEQMNTLVPNTIWTTLNRPSIHVALDSAYTVVGVNKYPMAPENGPFALANRNHGTMAMYNMKIWKPIQKDGAYISRIEDSQGKAHYIYDSYFALPTPLDVNLLVTGRIQYYYGDLVGYSKYIVLPTIMAERLYYVDGQIVKDTVAIDEPEDLDYTSASSNKKWKYLKPDLPVANSLMELKIWTSYKQEYITQYTRNGNKAFSYFTFNGQVVELDVKHTFAVNAPNIAAAGSYSFIDGTTFVDAVDKDLKLTKATSILSYLGYSAKLKATPADGYTFKGWYDEKNSKCVSTDETLFVFFTNDTTLTPHFEEVATDFSLKLTDRTGSSTDIYDNDGLQSEFVISKDGIKLNATATAAGDTKIRLYYCTESSLSDCTGNALKAIGSQFTFGSKNPDNYSKDIAVISNDGKITISGTSTAFSLPTNVGATFLWAELSRYRTSLTAVESVGKWVRLSWKYPVEFVKNDGTSPITTYKVSYGGSVTIPTTSLGIPAGSGTIKYDYYWQDMNSASTTYPKNTISISNITEAKKVKVVLSTEYLVQFVDFDGKPFTVKGVKASDAEQWIVAGQGANTPATNPDHKQNSDYKFSKWDKTYSNIGKPTTITAVYSNKITYATPTNAAWKTEWKLNGETPTNYTAPEVAGSKFVGWEPSLANVSGPATYTAKYVKIPKINFTVNGFIVGNSVNDLEVIAPNECFVETGRELLAESNFTNEEIYGEIYYGISREGDCASNELVQEIDAATGYNAVGITPEITFTDIDKTVYSEAHNIEVSGKKVDGKIVSFCVTFNQTPAPAYLITFKDTDGKTVLQSSYVAKDQMPTAPTSYTIPENTAQYKYSFGNWDPTIEKATKDQTYTAQLKQETQVYTVRFLDADGNQIGESKRVEYNGMAMAVEPDKSLNPKKDGFYFGGWLYENYGYVTKDTDIRPNFIKNPDMSFTVSGMTAGNSTLTVENGPSFLPDGCYAVSKAMLYDKKENFVTVANPMVAGETYTWKATISTFENQECLKATSDYNAYAEYSQYFREILNSVVPAYVNGVVANDDITNAIVVIDETDDHSFAESVTFDVSYTFVAEAAEEGDKNSSSSAAEDEGDKNSSSSVKPDDSDKSSSSSAKDDAEESSSSSKKKSSSSSADDEDDEESSSSSKKPNAIVTFDIPTFKATVSGRNLSIFGATVGAKTAIFDLQGSVISTGRVEAANFNVSLPRSGMYVVRIGNQIQKVNVR